MIAALLLANASFAGIFCSADTKDFDKINDYKIMKECMEGSQQPTGITVYTEKLKYCSCLVGALACKFGSIEEMNKGDQKDFDKALKKAEKCYSKTENENGADD
jgi:hypothetical protein